MFHPLKSVHLTPSGTYSSRADNPTPLSQFAHKCMKCNRMSSAYCEPHQHGLIQPGHTRTPRAAALRERAPRSAGSGPCAGRTWASPVARGPDDPVVGPEDGRGKGAGGSGARRPVHGRQWKVRLSCSALRRPPPPAVSGLYRTDHRG